MDIKNDSQGSIVSKLTEKVYQTENLIENTKNNDTYRKIIPQISLGRSVLVITIICTQVQPPLVAMFYWFYCSNNNTHIYMFLSIQHNIRPRNISGKQKYNKNKWKTVYQSPFA